MAMREALRRAGFDVPPEERERRDDVARRQNQGGGRGRGRGGQSPRDMPTFPDAYFKPDERGALCLQTEFVSRAKVDVLAEMLAGARLTTGQTRRFFNHCRDIERRLEIEGESWQEVAARFESLAFHAQNASSRRPPKIPREFKRFIDDNVDRVTSADDPRDAFLRGFLPHFEALVGFGAAYMRDN